jgi:hypothetical protein
MEPEDSLPHSQVPVTCPYSESDQSSPYPHHFLTYSTVQSHLEQLTGLQLVKKFPAFHGTRRFITALTSVRHLSVSWDSPIQFTCPHPTSWRSILILPTHLRLGLPSGLFPSGFPAKAYTHHLLTHTRHMPSPSHSSYLLTYSMVQSLLEKLTCLQLVK